jgi:hypothetical protein
MRKKRTNNRNLGMAEKNKKDGNTARKDRLVHLELARNIFQSMENRAGHRVAR